jgi:hypothetical protein
LTLKLYGDCSHAIHSLEAEQQNARLRRGRERVAPL